MAAEHGALRRLQADLHVHTCLSPCAELQMVPTALVKQARSAGLNLVGICDHNSGENAASVARAAGQEDIAVIQGMEITSREEVHVLGLFPSEEALLRMQELVYEHLEGENDEDVFGHQVVVNEKDEVLGLNRRLLLGATDLPLEQIVQAVRRYGGIAVAAHVDRPSFSIISQLGFIPESLPLDAVEVSAQRAAAAWGSYPVIRSSDAHTLDAIGRASTVFVAREPTFCEIRKALRGEGGRAVQVL